MTGRLAARALIDGLFIGHGTQKLFGRFEGPGREETGQMRARSVERNAIAADHRAEGPAHAAAGRG